MTRDAFKSVTGVQFPRDTRRYLELVSRPIVPSWGELHFGAAYTAIRRQ
jgi:hypothetical protein